MTDYLEEQLDSIEARLKQIRLFKQNASALARKSALKEYVDNMDGIGENTENLDGKSDIVPENDPEVNNPRNNVDHKTIMVDKPSTGPENREKDGDIEVNRYRGIDYNNQDLGQMEITVMEEEARPHGEQPMSSSPLSVQLEKLDRAVSALTALIPEKRETARGSYPIPLSRPQNLPAGLNITGVPGEVWSRSETAVSADFARGGTQSWAEQADRMFRRDSRRYDGGFTLY